MRITISQIDGTLLANGTRRGKGNVLRRDHGCGTKDKHVRQIHASPRRRETQIRRTVLLPNHLSADIASTPRLNTISNQRRTNEHDGNTCHQGREDGLHRKMKNLSKRFPMPPTSERKETLNKRRTEIHLEGDTEITRGNNAQMIEVPNIFP